MASQLTGILASAERIGKAQAALSIAQLGEEAFKYESEADIVKRCVRNTFMGLIKFKSTAHPERSLDQEKTDRQRSVMLHVIDMCLVLESWTLGSECAWFAGERDGYYYTAFFKPNLLRVSVHEIAHQCLDC